MKYEINIRVRVSRPLDGVLMQIQQGKFELLPPIKWDPGETCFEFPMYVDVTSGIPNFLGPYAQGPKNSRFIYVNIGTYAGQPDSCWQRRAKLPLTSVTIEQVKSLISEPELIMEAIFDGTGKDGTPTCATVKHLEWKIVMR